MEKKIYENPEIEVIKFEETDVMTASELSDPTLSFLWPTGE